MPVPVATGDNTSLEARPEKFRAGEEKGAAGGGIGSTGRAGRRPLYGEGGTVFRSGAILVQTQKRMSSGKSGNLSC